MKVDKPLVSICCITYNHASYIRQCLDGFLMQKTSFPFEIIINDDCSVDGTTEIIREYAEKYPNLIRPVYHDENQYQKGIRGMFQKFIFPIAKGKYIAMCEGDDYWIDPMKLQNQVEFLNNNPNISYVFTGRQIYDERKNTLIQQTYKKKIYYTSDILAGFNPGIQSNCFRKECIEGVDFNNYLGINGDRLIPYLCSLKGNLAAINYITAVYRKTGIGISTKIVDENRFEHASMDFYMFHKILSFPNLPAYYKGEARYVLSQLKRTQNPFKIYMTLKSINSRIGLLKFIWILFFSSKLLMEKIISVENAKYVNLKKNNKVY